VHAVEADGRNQLPIAYAQAIADVTGLAVDEQIVQSNVVAHTDANATQWLLARPTFDGPVEAGRPYILVDDAVGTGIRAAALCIHIQQGGGIPVFATALAAPRPPKGGAPTEVLAARPETRRALDQAFDRMELEGIHSHPGLPRLDQLTESQAR